MRSCNKGKIKTIKKSQSEKRKLICSPNALMNDYLTKHRTRNEESNKTNVNLHMTSVISRYPSMPISTQ